jgi:hypothetical protein
VSAERWVLTADRPPRLGLRHAHGRTVRFRCVARKINYHNFRFGLPAGDHTLTGCWYWVGDLQFCEEATISFG